MCCMVLPVTSINKKASEWCKFCKIGVGCDIHETEIPEECKNFECAYYQVNINPDLRPDKCKIIFEKVDNSIFLGTIHPHYNEAYKSNIIQKEIQVFLKSGFSVVFSSFTTDYSVIYNTNNREASEVWSTLKLLWKKRNDNTIIHNGP